MQAVPDGSYFSIGRDDLLIGGMRTMDHDPPDLPPQWLPYFVADITKAATSLEELGGQLRCPSPPGPGRPVPRLHRPSGASSALFEMSEGPARGVDGS
ncbi:MAG: hypothetical protein ACRDWS_03675 [Acidimicrobiia bacterium]